MRRVFPDLDGPNMNTFDCPDTVDEAPDKITHNSEEKNGND